MYFPHQYAARGTSPRCSPAFADLISLFTHLGPPSTVAPGLAGSKCHVFQLHGYAVFAQLSVIIAGCLDRVNRSGTVMRGTRNVASRDVSKVAGYGAWAANLTKPSQRSL